jgi:hypothetical protein
MPWYKKLLLVCMALVALAGMLIMVEGIWELAIHGS